MTAGYIVEDAFLNPDECAGVLQLIAAYRSTHKLAEICRPARPRPLRYYVIDGLQIKEHLAELLPLLDTVLKHAARQHGGPLAPLESLRTAINVNITPPGGAYRWHYDRNALTALVYLNSVEGGELDLYPNYRQFLPWRYSAPQRWLDGVFQLPLMRAAFGRLETVSPNAGRLVLLAGNKTLHSVRPVEGPHDRIALVLSYDEPGARFPVDKQLDSYLYTNDQAGAADPNYKG